jgi:hypothetical protein
MNLVHGTGGIDASSSPSPQSTYSAQSSPSESRTSPNVASKQQSTSNLNNKFSINSNSGTPLTSASSHVTSHHNDLTGGGGGATTRLNGKLKFLFYFCIHIRIKLLKRKDVLLFFLISKLRYLMCNFS